MRPLIYITFPQGFPGSKNIGHTTSVSGGKKTVKQYLKSEHTNRQTDKQTNIWTFRLIKSIGPEGQCFENYYSDRRSRMEADAVTKIKRNPKAFYAYAKRFQKTKSVVGPLINETY